MDKLGAGARMDTEVECSWCDYVCVFIMCVCAVYQGVCLCVCVCVCVCKREGERVFGPRGGGGRDRLACKDTCCLASSSIDGPTRGWPCGKKICRCLWTFKLGSTLNLEHLKMKNTAILAVVGSVLLFVAVDAACVSPMVSDCHAHARYVPGDCCGCLQRAEARRGAWRPRFFRA